MFVLEYFTDLIYRDIVKPLFGEGVLARIDDISSASFLLALLSVWSCYFSLLKFQYFLTERIFFLLTIKYIKRFCSSTFYPLERPASLKARIQAFP